jgi:NADPH-dependent glutamate synthase beta subunit-like oxidoreductase
MPDDRVEPDIAHGVPTIAVSSASTLSNRTGSWKYIQPIYQDRIAPCNAGCPVGIDIEGTMNLLGEGKVAEARDLLLRENPMPATTGRVCEHPCQGACSRGQFDEAVNIHAVERMLGDYKQVTRAASTVPARKEKVVVVGSGPAGLACAYHLARLGYAVTIIEADAEPGGWLRHGVPEYKLPRAVLAREIDRIRAAGVAIECGRRVGREVAWRELERYDAIFLAIGARENEGHAWEHADLPAVRSGFDFLREVSDGNGEPPGRRVVIVGGTDLAVDCARTARRMGREPVVVFRGAREDMAADPQAIENAIREGVRFEFSVRPVGLQVATHPDEERPLDAMEGMFDAAGEEAAPCLVGIACVRMQPLEPGAGGARRAVSVPNSSFVIPADTLLTALGAEPDVDFLPQDLHRRGYVIKADAFGRTSREAIFAGGDVTDQPRTVAHSLGSGKRVAIGIDHYLRRRAGEALPDLDGASLRYGATGNVSITRWRGDDPVQRTNELNEVVPFSMLNMAYFTHEPSRPDRIREAAQGAPGFEEANLGLAPSEAVAEAERCFNCGVCNNCEVCAILCPDVAIKPHESGHGFSLSYKYCKGCGLCVEECPRGAMTMTREGL